MAERFFDPNAVMFDMDGVTPCAGGTLTFSESGTSTPKDVFGDIDLSTNNGNIIDLGVDGRPEVEIFGEGAYRAILKNADGDTVWSRDNVILRESASEELNLPDYSGAEEGYVLKIVDGVPAWVDPGPTLPDPTGNADKYLTTDGDVYLFAEPPDEVILPEGGVVISSGSIKIGTTLIKYGNDTATSAASQTVTKAITYSGFASAPLVFLTPQVGAVTGESGGVEAHAASVTSSGFTGTFIAPDMGDVPGSENVTSNVPFGWIAIGTASA